MAKKKYSVSARADYHRSRMVSSTASDECPPERRAELKERIIGYLWDRLD